MSALANWIAAWSDMPKTREFSLWVVGDDIGSIEAAGLLIDAVGQAQGRLRMILTGPEAVRAALAARFPDAAIHAAPPPVGFAVRRFLHRANLRGVVMLDGASLPATILTGVRDEGLPLIAVRTAPDARPMAAAIAEEATASYALGETPIEDIVARLGEVIARDHKLLRRVKRFNGPALALAASKTSALAPLVGKRFAKLPDVAGFAAALGNPKIIMCLGNGPSSEDASLAQTPRDALFRVNRSWAERGFLTKPDVVFTGSGAAMAKVEGAIFGVRSEASELRLAGARVFAHRCGPTRYVRADEIAPSLDAYDWGAFRPTNGVTMLACAVALQPERLIVAGIDMFSHPDGAYPGDPSTPNAFAPAHDPAAELDFILELFSTYGGELVIVGEVLRRAWEGRNRSRLPDGARDV